VIPRVDLDTSCAFQYAKTQGIFWATKRSTKQSVSWTNRTVDAETSDAARTCLTLCRHIVPSCLWVIDSLLPRSADAGGRTLPGAYLWDGFLITSDRIHGAGIAICSVKHIIGQFKEASQSWK
jgi:hypothetical protein